MGARPARAGNGFCALLLAVAALSFTSAAGADSLALDAEPNPEARARAELEAVQRDPGKLADRAAVEALARSLEAFPPGRVRVEARLLVAEAWSHRLGEPERAIAACEAAVADPGGDRLTRALALSELWTLRRQRGEVREALAAVEREPDLSPSLTATVRSAARRARLGSVALAVLSVLSAIGVASLSRLAVRARDLRDLPAQVVRPVAVVFSLYLGGAAAVVVRLHGGEGDPRPFLWLGLAVLAITVIARAFGIAFGIASGAHGAAARATWAAACVASVVAAAFLAVERTDATYLESLGL